MEKEFDKPEDFSNPAADEAEGSFSAVTPLDVDDEARQKAEERLRRAWCGLLHPDTSIRHFYDLMQLAIMFYLGYQLPLRFAFNKPATGAIEIALTIVIDSSVWVDMYMQMHMGYYDSKTKKLVIDRQKIRRDYLKSWFLLDFFSVVPADQLLFVIGTLLVDRLIDTVYTLLKRLEVTKLEVAFYFRVAALLVLNLAAAHFLGCIWLFIGRHNVLYQQNPSGWLAGAYGQETTGQTKDFVSCIGQGFDPVRWNSVHGANCTVESYLCAPIPEDRPHEVDCSWIKSRFNTFGGTGYDDGVGAHESEQYNSALYFTIVTLTTVGYGDLLPDTPGEKQFVMACIIFGAFLYAYIIGDFSNLLSNLSHERDQYDSKMRSMNDLLAYIDVPTETKYKVQSYCDFKFNNKEGSQSLLEELPASLQVDLMRYRYGDLLSRVPFFASLPATSLDELCKHTKSFTISPGDPIMQAGQYADELLILSKGVARLSERDSNGRFQTFSVGAVFGETEFLGMHQRRSLTVVASTYCEVASLSPKKIAAASAVQRRISTYVEVYQSDMDPVQKTKELATRFQELESAAKGEAENVDATTAGVGQGLVISQQERLENLEIKVDGIQGSLDQVLQLLQAQSA